MNKASGPQPTITISVNGDGAFTYSDGSKPGREVHVLRGQEVRWTCADGNFVVLFKGASPFANVFYGADKGKVTPAAVVTKLIGHYSYSAMVVVNGVTRSDDPDIVVDEGPILVPRRPKRPAAKKAAPAKKATKKKR